MSDEPGGTDADGTEAVDLDEVELAPTHAPTGPPPLPPSASMPPSLSVPPPAPAGRSNAFYIGLLVAFVAVGIGVGIAVARNVKAKDAPPAVSVSIQTAPAPTASVMTLPTIDMTDDDGGK